MLHRLDSVNEERKLASNDLLSRIQQRNQIQQHLKSLDRDIQTNGGRMNTELNKKRTDNAELKQKLANNQQEIDILNEILLAKEQESNELSKQCKNLLENKTQTLE